MESRPLLTLMVFLFALIIMIKLPPIDGRIDLPVPFTTEIKPQVQELDYFFVRGIILGDVTIALSMQRVFDSRNAELVIEINNQGKCKAYKLRNGSPSNEVNFVRAANYSLDIDLRFRFVTFHNEPNVPYLTVHVQKLSEDRKISNLSQQFPYNLNLIKYAYINGSINLWSFSGLRSPDGFKDQNYTTPIQFRKSVPVGSKLFVFGATVENGTLDLAVDDNNVNFHVEFRQNITVFNCRVDSQWKTEQVLYFTTFPYIYKPVDIVIYVGPPNGFLMEIFAAQGLRLTSTFGSSDCTVVQNINYVHFRNIRVYAVGVY